MFQTNYHNKKIMLLQLKLKSVFHEQYKKLQLNNVEKAKTYVTNK